MTMSTLHLYLAGHRWTLVATIGVVISSKEFSFEDIANPSSKGLPPYFIALGKLTIPQLTQTEKSCLMRL